jgi:single-stranded DNA-binding protein
LSTRSWEDKDSRKTIHRTEIVALDIGLLSSKNGGSQGNGGDGNSNREKPGARSGSRSQGGYDYSPGDGLGIDSSDIPF